MGENFFEQFTKLNVLIIGDVMMDSYVRGAVERISPEAPVPVVQVNKKYFRLGGAGNVALNIAALGATPVLCSLIGNDSHGNQLMERLHENKIVTEGIIRSGERPTTVKTRVMAAHQHVVRIDEESTQECSAEEEKKLWEKIQLLLPTCDVVIFEDYDKGVLNTSLIEKTIALARQHQKPTIVDPKKRNFLAYKNVTLFKPNLKELREGLKLDIQAGNQAQLLKAASVLQQTLQPERMMITLSEHGVFFKQADEHLFIPANQYEIADVSGAGDTVVSVAALCLAAQAPNKTIATLANMAGGLVCQHMGVVPIDKDELKKAAKGL